MKLDLQQLRYDLEDHPYMEHNMTTLTTSIQDKAYPRIVVGTGSDAVFKFFSPNLGVALTDGCFMSEGTVVVSEVGMRELEDDDIVPTNSEQYTEELVAARTNRGSVERPSFSL